MINIKQKFTKFIISFCFLLALSACESSSNNNKNSRKSLSSNIVTEIALLLPLSGENELLGKQYAGMIKMGLGDGAKTKIKVTSYDCSDEIKLKESIKRILEQRIKIHKEWNGTNQMQMNFISRVVLVKQLLARLSRQWILG